MFRALRHFIILLAAMPLALAAADGPSIAVSGRIAAPASGKVILKLADLEKLPQHSFTTSSPWTRGAHTYSGPLLRDVLALVRAQGGSIKAQALNEYQIVIPVQDAQRFEVIVAHRIDGKPIPVRERGPFFIIYPFDQQPQLQSARYYERSIWQLKSLAIE